MWKLEGITSGNSVQSCLTNFLYNEEINLECSKCKKPSSVKKIDIIIEPSTLIIQLKRYRYEAKEEKVRKRHEEIKLSKKITMSTGSTYTLSSVVNHIGNCPDAGHYNLIIFDEQTDSFVLLDDLNVSYCVEMLPKMDSLSYVIFYSKDA